MLSLLVLLNCRRIRACCLRRHFARQARQARQDPQLRVMGGPQGVAHLEAFLDMLSVWGVLFLPTRACPWVTACR